MRSFTMQTFHRIGLRGIKHQESTFSNLTRGDTSTKRERERDSARHTRKRCIIEETKILRHRVHSPTKTPIRVIQTEQSLGYYGILKIGSHSCCAVDSAMHEHDIFCFFTVFGCGDESFAASPHNLSKIIIILIVVTDTMFFEAVF